MDDALERLERGPLVSRTRPEERVASERTNGLWVRPLAPTRVGWPQPSAIEPHDVPSGPSELLGDSRPQLPGAAIQSSPTVELVQRIETTETPADLERASKRREPSVAAPLAAPPLQPAVAASPVRVEQIAGPMPTRFDPQPRAAETKTVVRERELVHERIIERHERVIDRQEQLDPRPRSRPSPAASVVVQPRFSAPAIASTRVATPPLRPNSEPVRTNERSAAGLPSSTSSLRSREPAPIVAGPSEVKRPPQIPALAPVPSVARPTATSDSSAPAEVAPQPSRTHREADRRSADVRAREDAPPRVSTPVAAASRAVAPEPARPSAGLRAPASEPGALAVPPPRPTVTIEIGRIELITTPSKPSAPAPSPARSVARGFSIDAGGSYRGLGGRGGR